MKTLRIERKLEIAAAISFIIATLSYGIGNAMINSALISGALSSSNLGIGVLLEIINSIAVMAIGLFIFERLKEKNRTVMLGYALSRVAEAVILIVGSISVLFAYVIPSNEYANILIHSHEMFFSIAMLVLGVYSTYFCYYLLKNTNAPKLLMTLGMIGYVSTIIYGSINVLSLSPSATMILFAPGAIFEIAFPIWLIVKGFDSKEKG